MLRKLFILSTLVVTACQTTSQKPEVGRIPEAVPTPVVATEPVEDKSPTFDPDLLIGLGMPAIQGVLGAPDFLRWEGPAQVMQYENEECIVDLFFYEPRPGEEFLLRHIAGRRPTGNSMDKAICFRSHLPNGEWPLLIAPAGF